MDTQPDVWSLVSHYCLPVQPFLDMEGVTEICINRFDDIFIERHGRMVKVEAHFSDEFQLVNLVMQISHALNQPCSADHHPILDARLPDGSRVCAVLYPTSTKGTSLTIRVAPKQRFTPAMLVANQMLTQDMLALLTQAIEDKANIVISGGTGSGKTTILSVLSQLIPIEDRVITVEDTHELHLLAPNSIHLEAPKRQVKGDHQHVDMAQLIKTTLRMKPDRILVGEIRDAQAAMAFLQAINTGHRGTCTTLHANNPEDAINRLQTLIATYQNFSFETIRQLVMGNLDLLIHVEHIRGVGRKMTHLTRCLEGKMVHLYK
ncbi:MAG: CpaF family protein [Alphaproteobacteria bacterium]|nr:CpaF family protein [Alphaproteobacteria bacterium]